MYKCNDCGELFEEPHTYKERVGEFWGSSAYETFCLCPYCSSDDFEEYIEDDENNDS